MRLQFNLISSNPGRWEKVRWRRISSLPRERSEQWGGWHVVSVANDVPGGGDRTTQQPLRNGRAFCSRVQAIHRDSTPTRPACGRPPSPQGGGISGLFRRLARDARINK
jgi:hypothetical protein